MKKLFLLALALVLVLSLAACGDKETGDNSGTNSTPKNNTASSTEKNSTTANNDGDNNPAAKTPSIIPAAGWKDNGDLSYMKTSSPGMGSSIMIITNTPWDDNPPTALDYATKEHDKIAGDSAYGTVGDVITGKVSGMDSAEFTVTGTDHMTRRIVYVYDGKNTWTIRCQAADTEFDKVVSDFQKMIDSFTLK